VRRVTQPRPIAEALDLVMVRLTTRLELAQRVGVPVEVIDTRPIGEFLDVALEPMGGPTTCDV
jgi:hypothetical protein